MPRDGRAADDPADADRPVASRGHRVADPGTARIGPIDTTGFDGQNTTASASAIASSTPGAGRALARPAYRTPSTSSARPPRPSTPGSAGRRGRRLGDGTSIRVSTRSSLIGSSRGFHAEPGADPRASPPTASRPPPAARSGTGGCRDRGRPGRTTPARGRRPRPRRSRGSVSPRRPHPRSRSKASPSQ